MNKNSQSKYEATGTTFIGYDNNLPDDEQYVTFGLQSLKVTEVKSGLIYDLPDKFYTSAPTLQEARTEFFQRWKIYIQRKFKVSYIPVEIIN